MRRDEIIAMIDHELCKEVCKPHTDANGAWDTWAVAEVILKAIEDKGMRPPHTKVVNCNCYDHNWETEND